MVDGEFGRTLFGDRGYRSRLEGSIHYTSQSYFRQFRMHRLSVGLFGNQIGRVTDIFPKQGEVMHKSASKKSCTKLVVPQLGASYLHPKDLQFLVTSGTQSHANYLEYYL